MRHLYLCLLAYQIQAIQRGRMTRNQLKKETFEEQRLSHEADIDLVKREREQTQAALKLQESK